MRRLVTFRVAFAIVLILLIGVLPLISACAKPAPAPAPAPAPSPKPIVIKFTYHEPPPPPAPAKPSATVGMHYWLGEQIEKRTNGRVKFEYFGGAVLGKPFDFPKLIGGEGVADMGMMPAAYHTWDLPLWAAAGMPFLTEDADVGPRALWQTYQEWAPMQEEWKQFNLKPLVFFAVDAPLIITVKEPITKLEDLKGRKMGGGGGSTPFIQAVGATHVAVPIGEVYDSLSKGVMDGLIAPYFTPKFFKWTEVAKYLVPMDFLGRTTIVAIAINIDVWNKIPPQDQKVIEEVFAEYRDVYLKRAAEEMATINDFYKQQGMTFIYISAEEAARFKEKNKEAMRAGWIAKAKEKGVPIDEFLDQYQALMQ